MGVGEDNVTLNLGMMVLGMAGKSSNRAFTIKQVTLCHTGE